VFYYLHTGIFFQALRKAVDVWIRELRMRFLKLSRPGLLTLTGLISMLMASVAQAEYGRA
jgi:hypothetical protein